MTGRTRGAVVLAVAALALGAIGTATGITRKGGGGRRSGGNVARFATLTFGRAGGRAALDAAAPRPEDTPATFTEYRTPNDWLLRPAGVQLDTERAPTGVAASRDGKTVVAVNSGLFDEQITVVDVSSPSFTKKNEFTSDLYMGAVIDGSGILWVSTGSRNKIYEYQLAGADATCLRCEQAFPGGPDVGLPAINVIGYPGNMVLASDGRLFVAGNISGQP